MTEATPAAVQTASALVLPSAEDQKWADEIARRTYQTFRKLRAEAYVAEKLAEALEKKQLWRVNHLLTTEFKRPGPFSPVKLDVHTGLSQTYANLEYSMGWSSGRKLEKSHPYLYKHSSKAPVEVLVEAGSVDGVRLLVERGETPAMAAGQAIRYSQPAILEALEKDTPGVLGLPVGTYSNYYGRLNGRFDKGLMVAISAKSSDTTLDTLLSHAPPDTLDRKVLEYAIEQKNSAAALKLIAAGVSTADKPDSSPLTLAALYGLGDVVRTILDKNEHAAYADSIGGTLLLHATASRAETGWGARAGVVEVLLEKLSIPAHEIAAAMERAPSDTVAYKLLKGALAAQGGDSQPWRLLGPQQVGTVALDRENGLQLTEMFNLATGEHLILSRNIETKADTLLLRENFADMKVKTGIEAAQAFYDQRTKKPAPAAPKAA